MNIQEYISSGIIESYVLGLATQDERAEFETYCEKFPELVAARIDFEISLEKKLRDDAVAPSPDVKGQLMRTIRQDFPDGKSKIINMQTAHSTRRTPSMLRYVAAASIILLLAAAYFAYDFYNKNAKLSAAMKSLQADLDEMKRFEEISTRPNVAVVNMVGTTPVKASANVYWDSTTSDVYLVVKNLPKLPSEKQYQLWSIIKTQDGQMQPNSMGLFDVGDDRKIFLKMSNVSKADAFAITIENRGNTGGPTLDSIQTMGNTRFQ